jgi:hypothetical protein
MATCPNCLGPLTENHRCPHGLLRRITHAVWIVGTGGIGGALLTWVIWERPAPALVLAAAALGAVLANAFRDAVGRKS